MITRVAYTAMLNKTGTTMTVSHAGGSCDACFVFVDRVDNTSPTGVTWAGTSMTKLVELTDGNNHRHSIWGLQDALSGTQDAVVSAAADKVTSIGVVTYKGVHRTATFPDASNTGSSAVTTLAVAVTTTVDNCILLGLGGHNGLNTTAVGAGANTVAVTETDYSGRSDGIYESVPLSTGTAGSKTMNVTVGQNAQDLTLALVSVAPSLVGNISGNVMFI